MTVVFDYYSVETAELVLVEAHMNVIGVRIESIPDQLGESGERLADQALNVVLLDLERKARH